MATSTYIISLSDFEGRAVMTQNIKAARLKAAIGPTQEISGKKILCNEFYDEVVAYVAAGAPGTPVLDTLLPYLKDFLVYKTYARYLPGSGAMSTPAGLREQIDETSNPVSPDTLGALVAQANNDASHYQTQLVNFLTLNEDDYPTWRDSHCGCKGTALHPKGNNQFSMSGGVRKKTPINWI